MTELRSIPFAMIPIEAARDHRLSASDYRVLIAVLSFRKKNTDVAAVSREWLGRRAGYHSNSISRITARLERLGWLHKVGDGGRGQWSTYTVSVPDIETLTEAVTVSQNPNETGQKTLTGPDNKPSPDRTGNPNGSGYPLNVQKGNKKGTEKEHKGARTRADLSAEIREIFEYWQQETGHPRTKLDDKRRRKIRARLKDGYTVADLKVAIDGILRSPFHMGENDRNTSFDDIELICRDAPHVDKFIRFAGEQDLSALSKRGRQTVKAAQRWLERHDEQQR